MKRRLFLKNATISAVALSVALPLFYSCNNQKQSKPQEIQTTEQSPKLQLSLAQWSLHKQFKDGSLDPKDFASIAKNTYGIDAIEYVNTFYLDFGSDQEFWQDMKKRADDSGVSSQLIMVDGEGNLADENETERKKAVENHHKWIDAGNILGCHSIRVNPFGASDPEVFKTAMIKSLTELADYASQYNMNIIIENHGQLSSNAQFMVEIIKEVNKDNVGTLPDFGNWCISGEWGSVYGDCQQAYDIYQGVAEFLPYAKGVSAKSFEFDEQGNEKVINYDKMLMLVKDSGFKGHIGIEYEGDQLSEEDGINATKKLIEKIWKDLE